MPAHLEVLLGAARGEEVAPEVIDGAFNAQSRGVRPYAQDGDHAKALWAKSEQMVGERFAFS